MTVRKALTSLALGMSVMASPVLADGHGSSAVNRIDTQRPDAPELAAYGAHKVGVRTMTITNPDQIDILAIDPAAPKPDPMPTYDRELTVEVWYPAAADATGNTVLTANLRDGKTQVQLQGQAMRDAAPNAGKFPLVMISHGYPGNRYLLSHLAENIASKGYVVASLDHKDSTYADQAAFGSTLVNRSLDQLFLLDQMAAMSAGDGFLSRMVDADNTALIGYSMGGYGAVITAGGGVTAGAAAAPFAPHGTLNIHVAGTDTHNALPDPRIKTAVAFAPWGLTYGVWDAAGLASVQIPMLFVAGSVDDVSGYNPGIRSIWEGAVNVDRSLLTFDNANHNAAAPMPAPAEALQVADGGLSPYDHYADPVWDTVKMNNIAQHFVTAWLGKYLGGDAEMEAYLDLTPNANDSVWAVNEDGTFKDEHTHWKGFHNRTAKGLRFEVLPAAD
ncbi:dienelactone hydrolase [Amylibacter sp. IMCC11727]|uniref:alpha/beta hydrolase family protein n=1 Tax=Amylibacter sp. IMCC11727 TaxID=3039851 RepID=UPI00244E1BCD|nr:dienelactone hydrolase [Amylibacter sp. IMCC11727]WGI20372.1 dienelactone hydrolase [Amylibacter sp. IMCC11727]